MCFGVLVKYNTYPANHLCRKSPNGGDRAKPLIFNELPGTPADERSSGVSCAPPPRPPERAIDRPPRPGMGHGGASDATMASQRRKNLLSAPPARQIYRHGESDRRFLDAGTTQGSALSMPTRAGPSRARVHGSIRDARPGLLPFGQAHGGPSTTCRHVCVAIVRMRTVEPALHQFEGRQYAKEPVRVIGFGDEPQAGGARE